MKTYIKQIYNKVTRYLLLVVLCLIGVYSCKEIEVNLPLEDGVKPAAISKVTVKNGKGYADLAYELDDLNTKYVLAEYTTSAGKIRTARSSKYGNTIHVEGFPKEGKYHVSLYAVGAGEQKSDPYEVDVNIATPPIVEAFESTETLEDFGGINIKFENSQGANFAVDILTTDSLGNRVLYNTSYLASKQPNFSIRGFDDVLRTFFIVYRDRFGNVSDTIRSELTPLFEEQIDRTKMQQVALNTDTYEGHSWSGVSARVMSFMFDGSTTNEANIFHTKPNSGLPQHFTFALNKDDQSQNYKLSRFKMWMRNGTAHIFNTGSPKTFVVYGCSELNTSGSWDGWTELGKYTMVKPSGLPLGQLSEEDRAAHTAGMEFIIPIDAPAVKYIRIQTLETWGNIHNIAIAELGFWGSKSNM